MKNQTLTLTIINLENNNETPILIKASNPFMLLNKFQKINMKKYYVKAWYLSNNKGQGGNDGLNAEAYLWETLEELN